MKFYVKAYLQITDTVKSCLKPKVSLNNLDFSGNFIFLNAGHHLVQTYLSDEHGRLSYNYSVAFSVAISDREAAGTIEGVGAPSEGRRKEEDEGYGTGEGETTRSREVPEG